MDGRLPARVYWVRRAVALAVVALLGAAVALGVRAVARLVTPRPAPTGAVSSPSPDGIDDCDPAVLRLAVVPTAPTFPAGVSPSVTLTIDNTGTVACLVDAGDEHRQIVVTSGTDRVWSSQDCAPTDADRTLLLAAGESDTRPYAWNLTRSAPGCPAGLPSPGPGTYSLSFTVGGAQPAQTTFTVAPSVEPDPPTDGAPA